MKEEILIGRKVRGFDFSDSFVISYISSMNKYIGEIGEIIKVYSDNVTVQFNTQDWFTYPLDKVLEHLVEEEDLIEIL